MIHVMILIAYIIIMMPFRAVGVANYKILLTTSIPNHIVSYLRTGVAQSWQAVILRPLKQLLKIQGSLMWYLGHASMVSFSH